MLAGGLVGFQVSHLSVLKYTSRALVFDQEPWVSDTLEPHSTEEYKQRVAALQEQALARNRLSMIERIGIAKPGDEDRLIKEIRRNMTFKPTRVNASPQVQFNVIYTDSSPRRAQQICNELISLLLEENRRERALAAQGTMEFLQRQVEDARSHLQAIQAELAKRGKDQAPHTAENVDKDQTRTRNYESVQKNLADLKEKVTEVQMDSNLQGATLQLLSPACLPGAPDSTNRLLYVGAGLGTGLVLGIIVVGVTKAISLIL